MCIFGMKKFKKRFLKLFSLAGDSSAPANRFMIGGIGG